MLVDAATVHIADVGQCPSPNHVSYPMASVYFQMKFEPAPVSRMVRVRTIVALVVPILMKNLKFSG